MAKAALPLLNTVWCEEATNPRPSDLATYIPELPFLEAAPLGTFLRWFYQRKVFRTDLREYFNAKDAVFCKYCTKKFAKHTRENFINILYRIRKKDQEWLLQRIPSLNATRIKNIFSTDKFLSRFRNQTGLLARFEDLIEVYFEQGLHSEYSAHFSRAELIRMAKWRKHGVAIGASMPDDSDLSHTIIEKLRTLWTSAVIEKRTQLVRHVRILKSVLKKYDLNLSLEQNLSDTMLAISKENPKFAPLDTLKTILDSCSEDSTGVKNAREALAAELDLSADSLIDVKHQEVRILPFLWLALYRIEQYRAQNDRNGLIAFLRNKPLANCILKYNKRSNLAHSISHDIGSLE